MYSDHIRVSFALPDVWCHAHFAIGIAWYVCYGFVYIGIIDFEQSRIICTVKIVAIWLCQKTSILGRCWQLVTIAVALDWHHLIISKSLHIKAIVHSPLSRKCKFVQVVVWLCFCGCVGSINLTYFSNARPTCDVKALANRTSDNRLHRYHPCRVNQWKGGQPGHRDTNNMSVNDDLKKR